MTVVLIYVASAAAISLLSPVIVAVVEAREVRDAWPRAMARSVQLERRVGVG